MTEKELRQEKERLIKADIKSVENRVRHAFNQGYELGYQQHGKDFIEKGEEAYQQGLEDGRKQGVAIDGDKRYWKGYHAAQEDGRKIYQKGIDEGWAMIRKMYHDYKGNFGEKLKDVFGYRAFIDVIDNLSPSEAVEKIREHEEKQKQEEAKERFREKLESGYFSGKHKQDCDTCAYDDTSSQICFYSCIDEETGERTAWTQKRDSEACADSPCDLCRFNPPSSFDGKPCTICPAEGKVEE